MRSARLAIKCFTRTIKPSLSSRTIAPCRLLSSTAPDTSDVHVSVTRFGKASEGENVAIKQTDSLGYHFLTLNKCIFSCLYEDSVWGGTIRGVRRVTRWRWNGAGGNVCWSAWILRASERTWMGRSPTRRKVAWAHEIWRLGTKGSLYGFLAGISNSRSAYICVWLLLSYDVADGHDFAEYFWMVGTFTPCHRTFKSLQ